MATKGNNFGHKKSKKSWSEMSSSEQKRARTEYGQWKRSEEGRQGGTYYGVKPPTSRKKSATVASAVKKKKAPAITPKNATPPKKGGKVTKANYAPPSNSSTKTHPFASGQAGGGKNSTNTATTAGGRVKPSGPGNYSTLGKPSWGSPKSWKYDGKRMTRRPKGYYEKEAWWTFQKKYNPLWKGKSKLGVSHRNSYFNKTW